MDPEEAQRRFNELMARPHHTAAESRELASILNEYPQVARALAGPAPEPARPVNTVDIRDPWTGRTLGPREQAAPPPPERRHPPAPRASDRDANVNYAAQAEEAGAEEATGRRYYPAGTPTPLGAPGASTAMTPEELRRDIVARGGLGVQPAPSAQPADLHLAPGSVPASTMRAAETVGAALPTSAPVVGAARDVVPVVPDQGAAPAPGNMQGLTPVGPPGLQAGLQAAQAAQGIADQAQAAAAPQGPQGPAGAGGGGGSGGAMVPVRAEVRTTTEGGHPVSPETQQAIQGAQEGVQGALRTEGEGIAARGGQEAQRGAQAAAGAAKMDEERQRAEAERQKRGQMQLDRMRQVVDRQASTRLDPDAYWHAKGTGARILATLMMNAEEGFMAHASIYSGQHFEGHLRDQIEREIDRDIDAQKTNMEQGQRDVQNQRGLYADMLAEFGDERQAEAATKAEYWRRVAQEATSAATGSQSQQQRDALQVQASVAAEQAARYRAQLEQTGQDTTTTVATEQMRRMGGGGGAGGAAARAGGPDLGVPTEMRWYTDRRRTIENIVPPLREAEHLLQEHPDAPGTGPILNMLPESFRNFVTSDEGNQLRRALERMQAAYLHATTGAQANEGEIQRAAAQFGLSAMQSPRAVRNAIDTMEAQYRSELDGLNASNPDLARQWEANLPQNDVRFEGPGTPTNPGRPTPGAQPAATPSSFR